MIVLDVECEVLADVPYQSDLKEGYTETHVMHILCMLNVQHIKVCFVLCVCPCVTV